MKHLAKFMAGAMALGLWACSSDVSSQPDAPQGSDGDVYTSLTLALPTSTRSETIEGEKPAESNDGFEVGKDYENNVDQILVILASKDADGEYHYITKSLSNSILNQSVSQPTYTLQFESDELRDYADKEASVPAGYVGKDAYVFAYCNPTVALVAAANNLAAGDEFTSMIGKIESGDDIDIAAPRAFLMTNALIADVKLPTYEELVRKHNTKATAFNLGTVKVERVASRFDFQAKYVDGKVDNGYPINDNVTGNEIAVIEINGMSLFNLAKDYFYLPQMSATGTPENVEVCGIEKPSVWVVSPNAREKMDFLANKNYAGISGNYFFNLETKPEDYAYTSIMNWGNSQEDDNDDWVNSKGSNYKIWRYATENTMPGVNAQVYGLTTGVMFRGEIKASDAENVTARNFATALASGENVYSFAEVDEEGVLPTQTSIMLGTAMDVWKYAKTHNTSVIRTEFLSAVESGDFELFSDEEGNDKLGVANEDGAINVEKVFSDAVKSVKGFANNDESENKNFTTYAPTAVEENGKTVNKYYVYYPYYNRHNDNDDPATMGIMEFATVRNNIYKLRVDNVVQFGLPGDVPPPPPHEDETPEVYFKLSVQVIDWVVRVNNIIL